MSSEDMSVDIESSGVEQPVSDDYRVFSDEIMKKLDELYEEKAWMIANEKQLSKSEKAMEWFINCKNQTADSENPDVKLFREKIAIFNITRKFIGVDLASGFDFTSIQRIQEKILDTSSIPADRFLLEPMKVSSGISLKNSLSTTFPVLTDPSKLFVLPVL